MAFTAFTTIQPFNQTQQQYTTSSDVSTTALNTPSIALYGSTDKVQVSAFVNKSGGTSTDTVTVQLQASLDGTNWYDLPDVAGTGQEGVATSGTGADTDETLRLNYDFSNGSGQAKPKYLRVNSVSSDTNGTKNVTINFYFS